MDEPYAAAQGADPLIVFTEWNEFRQPDLARLNEVMREPVLVDGRNVWDQATANAVGVEERRAREERTSPRRSSCTSKLPFQRVISWATSETSARDGSASSICRAWKVSNSRSTPTASALMSSGKSDRLVPGDLREERQDARVLGGIGAVGEARRSTAHFEESPSP